MFHRISCKRMPFSTIQLKANHRYYSNQHLNKIVANRPIPIIRIGFISGFVGAICYDWYKNEFSSTGSVIRFLRSMKTASLIAFEYTILEWRKNKYKDEYYDKLLKSVHLKSAHRLLETCLNNGGLYIKVGQGVAAVNHILPKEYTDILSLLQDRCLPTSKEEVRKVFYEEFTERPENLFEDFCYTPVAAASLAQVFKAKLKSGENVAVKVQYRDLRQRFKSDLGTIIFIQNIIEIFFKNYNFGWILHEVYNNLVKELDFINEGKNSERCACDLQNLKFVSVPKVYWKYTTQRILTMEWIDGWKINDVNEIKKNKLNLREVDEKLFKIFAEQIFRTGFIHADPHPGNIFVRRQIESGEAELILLDHGLYEELPKDVRVLLCKFWEAMIMQSELEMKSIANSMKIGDYRKFAEILLQQPFQYGNIQIKTKLTEEDIEHMQEIAKKHFDTIMNTLKEMPKNMIFVVRNLNTIRAISKDHGDIVNRPRVMAKCAQRSVYTSNRSIYNYLHWMYKRCLLEYKFWYRNIQTLLMNLYVNSLCAIGRAPKSTSNLLNII